MIIVYDLPPLVTAFVACHRFHVITFGLLTYPIQLKINNIRDIGGITSILNFNLI